MDVSRQKEAAKEAIESFKNIFKDREGRTVYWNRWVYSWEYAHDAGFRIVVPHFPDNYLRISSDDALFKVRVKTKHTILLEHLPRGEVRQD